MENHLIRPGSHTVFFLQAELPFYFILQPPNITRCKNDYYCYPKVVCICLPPAPRTEPVDGIHIGRGILRKVWSFHWRNSYVICMWEQHLAWEQTPQSLASKKVGFQAKLLVQVPSAVIFTEAELYKHNHPTNLPLPLQDDVLFRDACLFVIIIKRTWITIIGD